MTEQGEQAPAPSDRPAASEGDSTPDHDPYYCVQHPESGEWLVVLKKLPGYLRSAIFEKTEGPDVPEDWAELRGSNWAINLLHMQAEEGSEEAKTALADNAMALPAPEGWNEWVEENFRPGEPDQAPSYYPEHASVDVLREAIEQDQAELPDESWHA